MYIKPTLGQQLFGENIYLWSICPKLVNRVKENIRANESETPEGKSCVAVPYRSACADGAGGDLYAQARSCAPTLDARDAGSAPALGVTAGAVPGAAVAEPCCWAVLPPGRTAAASRSGLAPDTRLSPPARPAGSRARAPAEKLSRGRLSSPATATQGQRSSC